MARIRSIHPGLTTDEAYMQMTAYAKAAWPNLWTECDDQGVFEWKPVVLKARLLPADNVDFAELLAELERLGCVLRFESGGKSYGAVRNFRRYQRPKKPNKVHPLTPEARTFVALSEPSSEPVPHQFGTGEEKSAQMEDEGGRMETSEENSTPSSADGAGADFEDIERKCRKAAGLVESPAPGLLDLSPIFFWLDSGYQLERHILPVLRAKAAKTKTEVHSWRFFDGALRDALQRDKPATAEPAKPIRYRVEQSGERWYVEVGSPEYRAWREQTGKGGSVRHRNGFQMIEVESRWPPGHAPAEPLRAVSG